MFKNNKQEYWFWMILFFINMLTFFVFMQGDDNKIHPNYIFNCISNLIQNNYVGIADGGDILSFARVGLNSKYYLLAAKAMEESFGNKCLPVMCGGSIPVASMLKEHLNKETIFSERVNGEFKLRRDFKINNNEIGKVLIKNKKTPIRYPNF